VELSGLGLEIGPLAPQPRPFTTNSPQKREEDLWAWGPHAALFDNATVIDAAAALAAAAHATAADSIRSFRVAQALTAVQFVAFYRWHELRAYASAHAQPWPFSESIAGEFDLFAAAMNRSGLRGQPITSTEAALAPNGSQNAGGSVTMAELRAQVLRHAATQAPTH
jgi:hypothetical protein